MAVFERTYRRWEGRSTPRGARFLVLFRYSIGSVFRSKLLTAFYALCFVYPVFALAVIYLRHNASFLTLVPDLDWNSVFAVDAEFFGVFIYFQQVWGFLLTVFIGPGLVSRDLANNGLPLYLSRPFTRGEYVLGRFSVLALLLSAITWVPALFLFLVHSNLAGWSWLGDHLGLVVGMVAGAWIWIVAMSIMALAVSAWVRWRFLAGFGMVLFALAGLFFHAMVSGISGSSWGFVLNLPGLLHLLWMRALGNSVAEGVPTLAAVVALAFFGGFFFLLLQRKLRAYEVIR